MIDPCSLESNQLIGLEDALSQILGAIQPISANEYIAINKALGRILADDVRSPIDSPFERNAAMDGYALHSQDIKQDQSFSLTLTGVSWAGKPYSEALKPGHCIRIFTGAAVPDGADSVVMQEFVTVQGDKIVFPAGIQPYQNIRQPGEDFETSALLCTKGQQLSPAMTGLLTSAGISCVPVAPLSKIAFFSTGDELLQLGQPLASGKIYDSNRYILAGLLAGIPVHAVDSGVIADDKESLKNHIQQLAQAHDVIVSSGGASVGDADFIKVILAELGQVRLWKIAVKPGKPLIFGTIGSCYYFGLPGNPVSMMLTFQQIVAPALNRLSGAKPYSRLRISATLTGSLKKSRGRQEFQRGILSQDGNGGFWVKSAGPQGSHLLHSMSQANCYIILPLESEGAENGASVLVEPFSTLL